MLNRKELFHHDLSNESMNQPNNSNNNENQPGSAGFRNSSSGNSNHSVIILFILGILLKDSLSYCWHIIS